MNTRAIALTAIVVLAGCGGGGGGGATPATTPVAPSQPTATPVSPSSGGAKIVLSFPVHVKSSSSTKRTPQYVPQSASQLVVIVNSVNGSTTIPSYVPTPTTIPLSTTVGTPPPCSVTGGVESCTVTVPAPPGSVNYTFNVEDSSGAVLSTLSPTITINQGVANTPSITLLGVVSTVTVSGSTLDASTTAASSSEALTTTVEDADGNAITGTYSNPVTLTDNDTSGATSLSLNGCTTAGTATVTLNSPSDVATLCYTGKAINPFTINATPSGGSSALAGTINTHANDVTFTGTTVCSTAVGCIMGTDADYGFPTLFFSTASGSQTVKAAELGFTDYSGTFTLTLSAGCSSIATSAATMGVANSYTITATGVGICSAQFVDGLNAGVHNSTAGADGTFYISVTTAAIGVNGHPRSK